MTTVQLDPDPLNTLETALRTTGEWCHNRGLANMDHYYIAKNPMLDTAISLCFTVVAPFNKLSKTVPARKCLVCDLYCRGPKETKERIEARTLELKDFQNVQPNQTKKE